MAEYRKRRPELYRSIHRRYREKHSSEIKQRMVEFRKTNRERLRKESRDRARVDSKKISRPYAAYLLSEGTSIPRHAWPEEIIQLKRAELQLKRHLKTYGKTEKHH